MTRSTLQGKAGGGASRIATRAAGRSHRSAREAREREHRRLAELCEARGAELSELRRARAELLSVLSHDLRNPLSVILVSARMLGRPPPQEATARRHLDAITRAADELAQLLQDMSDAAQLDEAGLRLELVETEVSALVAPAVEAARHAAEAKHLTVRITIADGLPPVWCDRERLTRLLAGLVASAVRLTPRAGTVEVRAERDAGGVRLSVTDGGAAITEEQRATLFDLPAAGSSRRGGARSAGVALFVARGLVEAHGGEIDVEPSGERGSTVWLTLPEGEPEGG